MRGRDHSYSGVQGAAWSVIEEKNVIKYIFLRHFLNYL